MSEIADKQIINGLDVSKCEFYNNNYCSCYRDNYGDCYHKCTDEELKDCYYKQLQQLKVENKRLKELLSDKPIETVDIDSSFEIIKLRQCLDECLSLIEKEVNPYDTLLIIKNNIKEVLNYE